MSVNHGHSRSKLATEEDTRRSDLSRLYIKAGMLEDRRQPVIYDYDRDSLQRRILSFTLTCPPEDWDVFIRARRHSLILCFRSMIGNPPKGMPKEDSLADGDVFWNQIRVDPVKAFELPRSREYISSRLEAGDVDFFVALGDSLRDALLAKKREVFNPWLYKIAEYWTHPDYPVWMMNNETASRFISFMAKKELSAEYFAQLVKRYGLVRFGRFPIRGVRFKKKEGENIFLGFELSRWVRIEV